METENLKHTYLKLIVCVSGWYNAMDGMMMMKGWKAGIIFNTGFVYHTSHIINIYVEVVILF